MRSYFILAICFLSLVHYFFPIYWLQIILAFFAVIAFIGSVTLAKTIARIVSSVMFTAGIVLTVLKGQGIDAAAQGITSNMALLTLLVLVPLLSIPFKVGGFFESILLYLKRVRNSSVKMFMGITTVLFFVGPILNLGSIRIIHDLIKDLRLSPKLLAKAYYVGFTPTMLWSPYYAAVGITLLYLNVSIGSYMSYGIGLAVLFLIVGNVLFWLWSRRQQPDKWDGPTESITPADRKRIKVLPFVILALLLTTIVIESLTHWSMLVIVSLLSLVFPVIWVLFSKQWGLLKNYLVDYRDHAVPVMNNEIIMYISAGFFGQSLRGTSFGDGINVFMTGLSQISFLLFALFILITMVCVTFIGIHQIVIVTVLATQMDPAMLGTSKEILAMVIMLAWTTSSMLSPVNPMNLLVSNMVNKSGIEIGIRSNGVFALVVSIIGIAILTFFH